jgi:hypothetical protein
LHHYAAAFGSPTVAVSPSSRASRSVRSPSEPAIRAMRLAVPLPAFLDNDAACPVAGLDPAHPEAGQLLRRQQDGRAGRPGVLILLNHDGCAHAVSLTRGRTRHVS